MHPHFPEPARPLEPDVASELDAFERGAIDPEVFDHAAHVRMAFALTGQCPFEIALARYCTALRQMCALAGRPHRFHMTVTVAFLAAVAERRYDCADVDETWAAFAARNADLLKRDHLAQWYDDAVLASDRARRTFILPPRRPSGSIASLD